MFKVLNPDQVEPGFDIHYHPAYVNLFQAYSGWQAYYAYYSDFTGKVILPFFSRTIKNTEYIDVVGPWYFGGPISTNFINVKKFYDAWNKWCENNNVVSEFHRLHPLFENHLLCEKSNVIYDREIVYVDLQKELAYEHKARKNIAKAKRENLRVQEGSLINFVRLYTSAMLSKNAGQFYFFNPAFYNSLLHNVSGVKIFEIVKGDEVICSSMIVFEKGTDCVYDYLRGTDPNYLDYRPNDLMLDHLINWSKENGFKYFVIGGGNTKSPDDNQLRFKKSFGQTKAFYLYKKVHNKEKYDALCKEKGVTPEYEAASYFPEYNK
jgi:serine/alanine adding enzyme